MPLSEGFEVITERWNQLNRPRRTRDDKCFSCFRSIVSNMGMVFMTTDVVANEILEQQTLQSSKPTGNQTSNSTPKLIL
jgi:hypothetical protein